MVAKADGHGIIIDLDWESLVHAIQHDLEAMYAKGAVAGHEQTAGKGSFDQLNQLAADYAKERAAELVGKKWVDGVLVDNPSAEWAISETTRARLRDLVDDAFEDGMTPEQLEAAILDLGDFSEERAETIARTELAMAQSEGAIEGWRQSGVVAGKRWLLGSEHGDPDECDENSDAGVIALGDAFPSGDDTAPAHPRCTCDVIAVVDMEGDGDE